MEQLAQAERAASPILTATRTAHAQLMLARQEFKEAAAELRGTTPMIRLAPEEAGEPMMSEYEA